MSNKDMITVTFCPQLWVRNGKDLVDAEPRGKTTFKVPLKDLEGAEPRSASADFLKDHPKAPKWVTAWDGPYEFEWELDA
jgi:hypothetical protein